MGPAPWAQQLLTLLAPHLLKHGGEQEDQEPPTQVHYDHVAMDVMIIILLRIMRAVSRKHSQVCFFLLVQKYRLKKKTTRMKS